MKSRERAVNFYDLNLNASLLGNQKVKFKPHPPNIRRALKIIQENYFLQRAAGNIVSSGHKTAGIVLEDWVYHAERDEHYLVISHADPKLSDVAFKDPVSGKSRMAGKQPQEAIDRCCHIILKPEQGIVSRSLMLQTSDSGVRPAIVAAFLGKLLKLSSDDPACSDLFQVHCPSGEANKKVKLGLSFEHSGHMSTTLQDVLVKGTIEGVELITDCHAGFDGAEGFEAIAHILKVDVTNETAAKSQGLLYKLLKSVNPITNELPSRAKVFFKEGAGADKRSQVFTAEDLDKAFTKREEIRFDTDIMPIYSAVSMGIIDKMRSVM
jgi:hypothetical protein